MTNKEKAIKLFNTREEEFYKTNHNISKLSSIEKRAYFKRVENDGKKDSEDQEMLIPLEKINMEIERSNKMLDVFKDKYCEVCEFKGWIHFAHYSDEENKYYLKIKKCECALN